VCCLAPRASFYPVLVTSAGAMEREPYQCPLCAPAHIQCLISHLQFHTGTFSCIVAGRNDRGEHINDHFCDSFSLGEDIEESLLDRVYRSGMSPCLSMVDKSFLSEKWLTHRRLSLCVLRTRSFFGGASRRSFLFSPPLVLIKSWRATGAGWGGIRTLIPFFSTTDPCDQRRLRTIFFYK